jgi:hypothetical protein
MGTEEKKRKEKRKNVNCGNVYPCDGSKRSGTVM